MKSLCYLIFVLFLVGCAHRLGTEIIIYDDISRYSPTPIDVNIPIYDSREDVPFDYKVIGQVFAAPMQLERDLGYNPVEMLKEQAREIGGIGLLNVSKGEGMAWGQYSAKVLTKREAVLKDVARKEAAQTLAEYNNTESLKVENFKWHEVANWRALEKGMSPSRVKELLGSPTHISSGYFPIYTYSRTVNYRTIRGTVTFDENRVHLWNEPKF